MTSNHSVSPKTAMTAIIILITLCYLYCTSILLHAVPVSKLEKISASFMERARQSGFKRSALSQMTSCIITHSLINQTLKCSSKDLK